MDISITQLCAKYRTYYNILKLQTYIYIVKKVGKFFEELQLIIVSNQTYTELRNVWFCNNHQSLKLCNFDNTNILIFVHNIDKVIVL